MLDFCLALCVNRIKHVSPMNTLPPFHVAVRQTYAWLVCVAAALYCISTAGAQTKQFYDTVTFPTTAYVADLAVADVNNDGIDDIVSAYDVLLGNVAALSKPQGKPI